MTDAAGNFALERRDGVVRIRMHTDGGPAVYSMDLHRGWGEIWDQVDSSCDVVIFTGTGDAWIGGADPALLERPFRDWTPDEINDLHHDRLKMLERLVFGVDVPMIGVVNGPGFHTELALFCDLTLCTPDTVFFDLHFSAGQVPGNGMFVAMQALLGEKRAAYHLYTGQPVTAAQALDLGLVHEVLPAGDVGERAWELAAQMARQSRTARRLTHALVQRPMRRRLVDDYGLGVSHGLLASLIDKT